MSDRIETSVELKAPQDRVWRALADSAEFGSWFGAAFAQPFVAGEVVRGRITHPGYEHLIMELSVVALEPPTRFVFTWHPYAVDPVVDYSAEPPTTVEFRLRAHGGGTRLDVVESGFDALPEHRRAEALRMNQGGWAQQMDNVRRHVDG